MRSHNSTHTRYRALYTGVAVVALSAWSFQASAAEAESAASDANTEAANSEEGHFRSFMTKLVGSAPKKEVASTTATTEEEAVLVMETAKAEADVQAGDIDLYPGLEEKAMRQSKTEKELEAQLEVIGEELAARISQISDPELALSALNKKGAIPTGFKAPWNDRISSAIWSGQANKARNLEEVYALSLQNAYQVRAFSNEPLIQETAIDAAEGAFDPEIFAEAQLKHDEEPTGSVLTTGATGRYVATEGTGEAGVRKRLKSGAEISFSNRLETLTSNSDFLDPNPQSQSAMVLRVVQPLLRGNGYHYNTVSIKLANLDSKMAAAQYIRNLENHLLDVNRSYWGTYLARAAYLQRQYLVDQTREISTILEDREEIDAEATASELLRVKASLAQREADLIRSRVAIRNSDERLRYLVNDPELKLGAKGEFVPVSRPIVAAPEKTIEEVVYEALYNRAEVIRALYAVKSAGVRRDFAKNELMPQLNLTAEVGNAGLGAGRDFGAAYSDEWDHGTEFLVGLNFSRPWSNKFARSLYQRRQLELSSSVDYLYATVNTVLLEALVSYREVLTAYQDMKAKYQAVNASREEVRQLRDRLDLDAGGRESTLGYQMQLILDALERNQLAEEEFLVSVVAYNVAIASVEAAQGTFLQYQDVAILRSTGETWKEPDTITVEARAE